MLKNNRNQNKVEAGLDEAGRGCLAGPVFAAAVILPPDYCNDILTDSKKLNKKQRDSLRREIEENATACAVASVDNQTIDKINIRNASYLAMHLAVNKLTTKPEILLIDGNGFNPMKNIPHQCIVKGDSIYYSIAAASILAKTHRDEYMEKIHEKYPVYQWKKNKGYGTQKHIDAILQHGRSPLHRFSFKINCQYKIEF
ncbi:MAG: ribonuclease HII [Bacteroidales bacterium]|nr:ribonuclease HII [Bacteroidales bacterium]